MLRTVEPSSTLPRSTYVGVLDSCPMSCPSRFVSLLALSPSRLCLTARPKSLERCGMWVSAITITLLDSCALLVRSYKARSSYSCKVLQYFVMGLHKLCANEQPASYAWMYIMLTCVVQVVWMSM